tara:strand:+ start:595 stop:1326 length:732 start_codon:yes stop_codon:yes gene_type:complete
MKCVIIDDEPLAVDIIESYILKIGELEIVAKCNNPFEAITVLNENHIDLVFLDIEMPNLTGIDLVQAIENMPQFIFTTAYPKYALDGFNLNATDYLVKPIAFHRFLKAIARAKEKHELEHNITHNVLSTPLETHIKDDYIFVKSDYKLIKIELKDLMYIEGLKDYVKFYTVNSEKPILSLMSMKSLEKELSNKNFMRVHRSFIVNLKKIVTIERNRIVFGKKYIPVSEKYKENFQKFINSDFP